MKRSANAICVSLLLVCVWAMPAVAMEITLFGSDAHPAAYIADEMTIYLWSGEPVAYLHPDYTGGFSVYGYNGRHLGWYASGIVYDHAGRAVGARKEALIAITAIEPIKGIKRTKPIKCVRQIAPIRPIFMNAWSPLQLDECLLQGTP